MDDATVLPTAKPRRARRVREEAPTTPDPIEIAMDLERGDASPDSPARRVLIEHHRLLSAQVVQARLARVRERIAVARDFAAAGLVVVVFVGVLGVLWAARQADGLVVEPFSVPPAMAERGLDGAAVASLFLDKLSALQAQTQSGRAPASYGHDWGEDLSVDIAGSGVSVGDVWRELRRSLGHESRMTGGLVQENGRLSLVVRTGATAVEPAVGAEGDLDALLQTAAERVYEQTQPYRYAMWLGRRARALPRGPERAALEARSVEILKRLTNDESPVERVWAYNGLGVQDDLPPEQGAVFLRAGLEIDPDHNFLLGNLAGLESALGHDAAAAELSARALAGLKRKPKDMNPAVIAADLPGTEADVAAVWGDYGRAAEFYAKAADVPVNNTGLDYTPVVAEALIFNHDLAAARRRLARAGLTDDAAVAARVAPADRVLTPWTFAMEEAGDWAGAVVQLGAADPIYATRLTVRSEPLRRTLLWPRLAYAKARAGDLAGAQALIARTPADCLLCVTVRGQIAALAGDKAGADRWLAEAVRQAPNLPFPFSAWGQVKAARGDQDGAIALYRKAQKLGPRWADPLKFEADALVAKGEAKKALALYRKAAALAPRWGALHLAWGDALAGLGRRDEAQARWREAAAADPASARRVSEAKLLAATLGR
ncbi:hypothetical protein [Caulobacter sp. 17J65-9]|uniref:tetratricopeptide repeat protein n=1 Tax=Caulobacter sp. 17J65-9 TaxID=2709382 RepID=UPI0013C83605|nr:hypothetical protein [Caulobacter sp. 17J65-9]NEX94933.1 hypothetical protein [Caulobacter sp. 17J65-9]